MWSRKQQADFRCCRVKKTHDAGLLHSLRERWLPCIEVYRMLLLEATTVVQFHGTEPAVMHQVCNSSFESRTRDCTASVPLQTYLKTASGSYCHCDYFCDNDDSCCGGAASKNALCPHMKPTLAKSQLTDCGSGVNKQSRSRATARVGSHQYLPGVCWCDKFCAAAGDCCPQCTKACGKTAHDRSSSSSSVKTATVGISSLPTQDAAVHAAANISSNSSWTTPQPTAAVEAKTDGAAADTDDAGDIAAVLADSSTPLSRQITAEAAAAAARSGNMISDCGSHHVKPQRSGNDSLVGIAQESSEILQIEFKMQQCQAADKGPPAKPYIIPIHWTAGTGTAPKIS